jgi:competence protein ComEC
MCLGLALSLVVRAASIALPVFAIALGALALVLTPARIVLLCSALVVAGWSLGSARLEALDHSLLAGEAGESAHVQAEVVGPARPGRYVTRVPVRVRRLFARAVNERAQLELPVDVRAPPQGAIIEAAVRIRLPRERDEASGFDERAYLRRLGVHAVLRADRYLLTGRRGGLSGIADRLRAALARSIAPGLEGERKALVAGVVLGEDQGLEPELRARFRASGLYHLLAVSGQNVAYVVAGVLLAGWLAGIPRWAAQLAALGGVLAYVAAVGWQPSVVRAGVAGGLASLAWLLARPRDRWYFALLGAAVLLAVNPYSLFDPGFQLSFAAVAAIFVLVPRLERRLEGYPVPGRLASVLAVSGACGVVTAPILWAQFGAVPLLSILANTLAAPVVAPILGFGLGAAAVSPVLPSAADALAWVNGWLVAYLAWCARAVGGLPFAQLESGFALVAVVAPAVIALAVLLWRRAPPLARRAAVLAVTAVIVTSALWALWPSRRTAAPPPPSGLRVTFLDVGQGDSALLQVPEGAVLVDEGPPEAHVERQLAGLGVERLAALVLTHPQRDHIGGAGPVLRQVQVGVVLDPRQPAESPFEDEAMREAGLRGVRVVTARVGLTMRLGRLLLRVLWPDDSAQPGDDPNDHAIVLLATYGTIDVLLTADAESNVTGRLTLPPVEVLKVAHHGSADPGLPDLLARLQPRIVVISVGRQNDYGHPTPSTLAALHEADGLRVYRTDEDGRVEVDSDGTHLVVRTEG